MMQFSLISLVPGLLRSLHDCADPEFDHHQQSLVRPSSLRTSDRNSCQFDPQKPAWLRAATLELTAVTVLSYMGLPLQVFGKVC